MLENVAHIDAVMRKKMGSRRVFLLCVFVLLHQRVRAERPAQNVLACEQRCHKGTILPSATFPVNIRWVLIHIAYNIGDVVKTDNVVRSNGALTVTTRPQWSFTVG